MKRAEMDSAPTWNYDIINANDTKGTIMQTIQLEVDDNSVGIVLTLIENLKNDIIKDIKIINNGTQNNTESDTQKKLDQVKGILKNRIPNDEKLNQDPYFYERQKELHQIRTDVKNGNMEMLSEEQYEQEIEAFFEHIEK